jgi:hypothetical protein
MFSSRLTLQGDCFSSATRNALPTDYQSPNPNHNKKAPTGNVGALET